MKNISEDLQKELDGPFHDLVQWAEPLLPVLPELHDFHNTHAAQVEDRWRTQQENSPHIITRISNLIEELPDTFDLRVKEVREKAQQQVMELVKNTDTPLTGPEKFLLLKSLGGGYSTALPGDYEVAMYDILENEQDEAFLIFLASLGPDNNMGFWARQAIRDILLARGGIWEYASKIGRATQLSWLPYAQGFSWQRYNDKRVLYKLIQDMRNEE